MSVKEYIVKHKLMSRVVLRGVVCLITLLFGSLLMKKLASLKEAPQKKVEVISGTRVTAVRVKTENISITFTEYGTARPANEVSLSSQVTGIITQIATDLKKGRIVEKGEIIVVIDKSDYQIKLEIEKAEKIRLESDLRKMELSYADDTTRLASMGRDYEISKREYERKLDLKSKNAASISDVDTAEQAKAQKENSYLLLKNVVDSYPMQLDSQKAQVSRAQALIEQARLNLDRCVINAPYKGRITFENVEVGALINSGVKLVSISDDSSLEIEVSLNAMDALNLGLKPSTDPQSKYWIEGVENIKAKIRWVEADGDSFYDARVDRIDSLDELSRTVKLVVSPELSSPNAGELPLTAGMFCKVDLMSSEPRKLIEIPRDAVQFGGKIFSVDKESNRLHEKTYKTSHGTNDSIYIKSGLSDGDMIVTSKLPFELIEGLKVSIVNSEDSE